MGLFGSGKLVHKDKSVIRPEEFLASSLTRVIHISNDYLGIGIVISIGSRGKYSQVVIMADIQDKKIMGDKACSS